MDNQKTCADCVNLGRAVYCMQCKRMRKGHKDMFVEQLSEKQFRKYTTETAQAARN